MNVGSLFSGIGGLDLGLERAGMTVRWQSEIDPYASKVLAKHWPDVPNLGDVTTIDWSNVEPVDLICGGYPCQPFSLASPRRMGELDPRYLWPHFANAIRHIRPGFVLLENVPGHLSLGFGPVLGNLAKLGYDAEWTCVPAAAVGAPHLRYRLFVVAYPHIDSEPGLAVAREIPRVMVPDTDRKRRLRRLRSTQEPELASWWAVEPDVGRVAHGVPSRVDRLRCLGNAVVPQVAQWIGERIMQAAA